MEPARDRNSRVVRAHQVLRDATTHGLDVGCRFESRGIEGRRGAESERVVSEVGEHAVCLRETFRLSARIKRALVVQPVVNPIERPIRPQVADARWYVPIAPSRVRVLGEECLNGVAAQSHVRAVLVACDGVQYQRQTMSVTRIRPASCVNKPVCHRITGDNVDACVRPGHDGAHATRPDFRSEQRESGGTINPAGKGLVHTRRDDARPNQRELNIGTPLA